MPSAAPRRTPPDLTEPVVAAPPDPPVHHVRAALDLRLRALLAHEPGTRSGEDIEDLHQMRVAVRRMRATLKAARPLLDPSWADGLRAELGALGGALGPVRDLDVLLVRLRAGIAGLPGDERAAGGVLVDALEAERAAARDRMLAALDTTRHAELVDRLVDTVRWPLPTPPEGAAAGPGLVELVRVEARRLRKAVARAGDDPPDAVLHALRILGKRLRYTGELVGPGLRGTPAGGAVKRLLGAAAALQEVLGEHQDACVAEVRIRGLLDDMGVRRDPAVVFVAGRLVERERARAERERALWPAVWAQVAARIDEVGPDAVGPDAVGPDAGGPDAGGPDAGGPDAGGIDDIGGLRSGDGPRSG